jgi:hypothetical protein
MAFRRRIVADWRDTTTTSQENGWERGYLVLGCEGLDCTSSKGMDLSKLVRLSERKLADVRLTRVSC